MRTLKLKEYLIELPTLLNIMRIFANYVKDVKSTTKGPWYKQLCGMEKCNHINIFPESFRNIACANDLAKKIQTPYLFN